MKLHPASKFPATGPVITGHKDEVSTPTSFDPAQAPEDRRHCHGFPNHEADSTQITWEILERRQIRPGVEIISVSRVPIGAEPVIWQVIAVGALESRKQGF